MAPPSLRSIGSVQSEELTWTPNGTPHATDERVTARLTEDPRGHVGVQHFPSAAQKVAHEPVLKPSPHAVHAPIPVHDPASRVQQAPPHRA
jgi:hypothetical protein